MAEPTSQPKPVVRTLVALAAVLGLLHWVGTNDLLSDLTRPLVVALLKLMGVEARDAEGELVLGRLHVPWTRDCAGVDVLTMLWAVALWTNRAEPLSGRFWLRIALVPPAALIANIARIFTLLAYRSLFFPAVESPQLHYFIGFLWVVPCLPVFVPRAGRAFGRYLLETIYLVAALSLLSPFVPAPGGTLVAIATLLLLAGTRYASVRPQDRLAAGLWILAAAFVALASMESLWLPWLLLCPWLGRVESGHRVTRFLLVLGTIPLVAMHPVLRWLVAGAAAIDLWKRITASPGSDETGAAAQPSQRWPDRLAPVGLALLCVVPFVASSATGLMRPTLRPPLGSMASLVALNTYEVRLVGQPQDITLTWYGPSGDGRHHTLPVCMRYRGVQLRPVAASPGLMTDGRQWMREFFFHRGSLLMDYRAYLGRTLWPWSPAGVHLIASAPTNRLSALVFAQQTEKLARELHSLGAPLPQAIASPHSSSAPLAR